MVVEYPVLSNQPKFNYWHFNFSQWNPQVWGQSVAFILAIGLWNTALCTQAFAALLLPQLCEPQLFQRGCFWRSSICGQIMSNHQDFFQKKCTCFFHKMPLSGVLVTFFGLIFAYKVSDPQNNQSGGRRNAPLPKTPYTKKVQQKLWLEPPHLSFGPEQYTATSRFLSNP